MEVLIEIFLKYIMLYIISKIDIMYHSIQSLILYIKLYEKTFFLIPNLKVLKDIFESILNK